MAFKRARAVVEILLGDIVIVSAHHQKRDIDIPEHCSSQRYLLHLTGNIEPETGNNDRRHVDSTRSGLHRLENEKDGRRHQRCIPWYEIVNQPARKWAEQHAEHAHQSEKADVESERGETSDTTLNAKINRYPRRVVVWRSTEQERQRDPEAGETRAGCEADQRSLYHEWFRDSVFGHGVQNFEIRPVAIHSRIIW